MSTPRADSYPLWYCIMQVTASAVGSSRYPLRNESGDNPTAESVNCIMQYSGGYMKSKWSVVALLSSFLSFSRRSLSSSALPHKSRRLLTPNSDRFHSSCNRLIKRSPCNHRTSPMSVRTVKVSNLSHGASEQDVREFFSFSGEIEHVDMQSGDEWSQIAYVTFKDAQGADTALLLSGATIVDMSVIITAAPEYKPPPSSSPPPYTEGPTSGSATSSTAVQKAEDVVSTMLAKGFVLGKDAVGRAKSFDQKLQLTSTASAKVASLDRKIGLSEKFSMGTSAVNGKVREVDSKFQVSEKTKVALATAKQGASNAGSAIMKNRFVFTGVSWVSGAFSKVAEAATDVSNKTKEKMAAEEQQKSYGSGPH